jgi:hypothetical protein
MEPLLPAYTVTMDAQNKCTEGGKDVKFTCVASFPASITNGPSVTWHRVDSNGEKVVQVGNSNDSSGYLPDHYLIWQLVRFLS